jgi:hypothetical protein
MGRSKFAVDLKNRARQHYHIPGVFLGVKNIFPNNIFNNNSLLFDIFPIPFPLQKNQVIGGKNNFQPPLVFNRIAGLGRLTFENGQPRSFFTIRTEYSMVLQ